MQKSFIPALLFVLLLGGLSACSKSSTDTPENLNGDLWSITSYQELGNAQSSPVDLTSQFYGYTFELNDGNVMVIHLPAGSTQNAKWITDLNANTITFAMNAPFAPVSDILEEWTVTAQTDTKIELETGSPVSALDGKILHFTKQ